MRELIDSPGTDRMRGLLLGLALGEAVGLSRGAAITAPGRIRAGVGTQLAAFTVDGLIRAGRRMHERGLVDVTGVLWHSLCRWAVLQGIEAEDIGRRWRAATDRGWPDGWLSDVPALSRRRGSAPATVAAARGLMPGTLEDPATDSAGWHGLIRTLPVAAVVNSLPVDGRRQKVMSYAALTHGQEEGAFAAYAAAAIAARCLAGEPVRTAVERSGLAEMGTFVDAARVLSASDPGDAAELRRYAEGSRATAVLYGGLYAALSFPAPDQVWEAISFTAAHADCAPGVAAFTGALLGATHGAHALPVDPLSRHELTWVLDTLARDLAEQLRDGERLSNAPEWRDRYPAW